MLYNLYIVILGTTVNITINLYYIKMLNKTKGLTPLDKESAQGIACVFYFKIRLGNDNHSEYEYIDSSTLGHLISHWSRDDKTVRVIQQHIKSKTKIDHTFEMKRYPLANELEQDIACFSYSASDTEYKNSNTNKLLKYKYG